MKQSLLIALLGATVALATPVLSYADNGFKFQSKALDRNHQYKHKHGHKHHHNKVKKNHNKNKNKNRQFVYNQHGYNKKGFNKYGFNRHGYNRHGYNKSGYNRYGYNKHGYNRHGYNKKGYNRHGYNKHKQHYSYHNKHKNNSSFSVTWNVGNSTISYGNDKYAYNNGYNEQHRKYRGKKIYNRLNSQASRIQNGIHNGQLVHREVDNLRHEQRTIKNKLSHYKRDGHLNKYEHDKLNQMLDVASQNIHRKSNNRKTRYAQQHHNNYDSYTYHVQF